MSLSITAKCTDTRAAYDSAEILEKVIEMTHQNFFKNQLFLPILHNWYETKSAVSFFLNDRTSPAGVATIQVICKIFPVDISCHIRAISTAFGIMQMALLRESISIWKLKMRSNGPSEKFHIIISVPLEFWPEPIMPIHFKVD